jgi:hypothetical protein
VHRSVVQILRVRQVRIDLLANGRRAVREIHENCGAARGVQALNEPLRLSRFTASIDAFK